MPPGFNQHPGQDRGPRAGATLRDIKRDSTVFRLFGYILRNYKVSFIVVLLCIVVSSLTSLASSLFTRSLIDDYITPMTAAAAPDYAPLAVALVKLGAVILVGIIAGYAQSLIMIHVGQGTMLRIRKDLFSHMEKLPLKYFDNHSHGDIMSVYTNDVDTLRQVIGNSIPSLFRSVVTILATFVSMLVLSLPLTVVAVAMAFLMYKVTTGLGRISKKYFVERQRNLGRVNGFIEEMVSGQKVVKVYCHERKALEDFAGLNEELRSSVYNANKIGNIIMPINSNIGNFMYVLLAIVGSLIALGHASPWYLHGLDGAALTLGTLVSFLTLQRNFTRPVTQISNEINSLVMATAGSDRVYALLDEEPELDEGTVTLEKEGEGRWSWKEPDGALRKLEGLVSLKDVDFTIRKGGSLGIIGATGSGKTTIINLLMRFYDPGEGHVFIDGQDVRTMDRDALRRRFGTVFQNDTIFASSIRENVVFGRNVDEERLQEALGDAMAADFVNRYEDGADHMAAIHGGNFSGGQKQRLLIARAVAAKPEILILDDSSSALDYRTDAELRKAISSRYAGTTLIVIAQRVSSIMNLDEIIVLDEGEMIGKGTHEELMRECPVYREIQQTQMGEVE